ncbi:hypothetical protein R70723_04500 [Paenibacillus sp. FSL R7-0273]|nr:hypothetical protein R70723_04500 [Paenibacillus sp. FSL R7-0273]
MRPPERLRAGLGGRFWGASKSEADKSGASRSEGGQVGGGQVGGGQVGGGQVGSGQVGGGQVVRVWRGNLVIRIFRHRLQ